MLMGKVVSKKKYEYYEYITSVFICIGMGMFLVGSRDTTTNGNVIFTSGVLLVEYLSNL